ncbi:MAG: hypothetical protein ACLU38_03240 [Dysosmobacter sp.]
MPPICERWQRSCPVTEARRKRPWPSISGRLRRLRPRSASWRAEQAQLKAQGAVISERLAGISQERSHWRRNAPPRAAPVRR